MSGVARLTGANPNFGNAVVIKASDEYREGSFIIVNNKIALYYNNVNLKNIIIERGKVNYRLLGLAKTGPYRGLSCMMENYLVQFLGGNRAVRPVTYPVCILWDTHKEVRHARRNQH